MPITIYTRDNVPKKYKRFSTMYDDDDGNGGPIWNTYFVIHISEKMTEDSLFQFTNRWASNNKPMFESDLSSWLGRDALGANTMHTEPEPNGDGHIIVLAGV